MDGAAAAISALLLLPLPAVTGGGEFRAGVSLGGGTGRDDCEPGGGDDAAGGLLADAAFGRAGAAGLPVSAVRVGGTAANASLGGAAGAVVLGAVDCEPVLLDDCGGGFVAGGVVLAALPCAVPGFFAAGGVAGFGAGLAVTGALNAPLLLCVPGSMRCGAAPHPARPMMASRQGREPTDRCRGKSLAFGMAAA